MADKVQAAWESMIRNLEQNTGKTLSHWLELARKTNVTKHRDLINHLKTQHNLTYGYANMIAQKALQNEDEVSTDQVVDAQYTDAKAALRPIYNKLIAAIQGFGDDVEVSPKKAYVSLRRNKQFALIQSSTNDRVDVGISLKGVSPSERLEASGSFNAMVSHRVRITDIKQVDKELLGWLKQAYEVA